MRDFYEKFYFFELDRKSKIQAALAFPIGISGLGMAALGYTIELVDIKDSIGLVPIALSTVAIAAFAFVFYYCSRTVGIKKYNKIPSMDLIRKFEVDLQSTRHTKFGREVAKDSFDKEIIERLAASAAQNSKVNDLRAEALYKANRAAVVLILFSLLSAAMVTLERKMSEIESMADDNKPVPAPTQPQAPQLPPNQDRHDGANIRPLPMR